MDNGLSPRFEFGERIRIHRVIHKVSGVYHNLVDDIFEYRLGFLKNGMSDQDLIHTINKVSEFLNLSVTITKE